MVCIIEWQTSEDNYALKTGHYGARHCARNATIKSVPHYAKRTWTERKYSQGTSGRYHEVSISGWKQKTCNTSNYSVGGGNWLTYNP